MGRFIADNFMHYNFAKRLAATLVIIPVVVLLFTAELKSNLRLHKDAKKSTVEVEFVHTPQVNVRSVHIVGFLANETYITDSYIQSDGENCPIIHRIKWRVPFTDIFVVQAKVQDANGKIVEQLEKKIILGVPTEGSN